MTRHLYFLIPPAMPYLEDLIAQILRAIPTRFTTRARNGGIPTYSPARAARRDRISRATLLIARLKTHLETLCRERAVLAMLVWARWLGHRPLTFLWALRKTSSSGKGLS